VADEIIVLRDRSGREHRVAIGGDETITTDGVTVHVRLATDGSLQISGEKNLVAWAVVSEQTRWVFFQGNVFTFELERSGSGRRRGAAAAHGGLTAPMPATVRKILVAIGDQVGKGDVLLILEAMKMELPLRADSDGVVESISCREGELVQPGKDLVQLSSAGSGP
jgi:geranyl-CoA carboxylase alpha subunit